MLKYTEKWLEKKNNRSRIRWTEHIQWGSQTTVAATDDDDNGGDSNNIDGMAQQY